MNPLICRRRALRGIERGLTGIDPQPARPFATCTSLTRDEQDQDA
jgi:hypothetical protein